MTDVYLALYRGPGHTALERLTHVLTSLVVSLRKGRWETHSHAELVIDGVAYSASLRDRGMRAKVIDFDSSWDLYPVENGGATALAAKAEFEKLQMEDYDVAGVLAWAFPAFFEQETDRMFCFEAVASMLRMPDPHQVSGLDLLQFVKNWNAQTP